MKTRLIAGTALFTLFLAGISLPAALAAKSVPVKKLTAACARTPGCKVETHRGGGSIILQNGKVIAVCSDTTCLPV